MKRSDTLDRHLTYTHILSLSEVRSNGCAVHYYDHLCFDYLTGFFLFFFYFFFTVVFLLVFNFQCVVVPNILFFFFANIYHYYPSFKKSMLYLPGV